MTDAFLIGDGTVRVQAEDGSFEPIQTPEGITDFVFRNVIAAADTLYRLHGSFPSVKAVQTLFPRATQQTISTIFLSEAFKQAMDYRGVQHSPDSGLSIEQQMALLKLSDFTDARTTSAKLKEMGIPLARYQAWMKQPLFAQMYHDRMEAQFAEAAPLALNKLMVNMEKGDQRAIEKVLEITGRWNPAQQQIEDVRMIVRIMTEAIVRHVSDKSVREAIMGDIATAAQSFTITQPRQIEG